MDDSWLGTELAGYRLEALVGRGGVGVVYRALHLRLGRTAAVKLLAGGLASDPDYQRRFEREAGLAAGLQHPHVVPIYDAGHARGVLYLAMAFIDGPSLATVISAEAPMSLDSVCGLLGGVAEALDNAHQAGLLHRDVKPANILVAPAEPAAFRRGYLCDFGIARRISPDTSDSVTGTGQFVGTLAYCAPEQIQGQAMDGRVDQYALGCVVYQCLTGRVPFPGDEPSAVMFGHLSAEPPAPSVLRPELPAGVDAVLARALAKVPTDRYPSSAAFVAAIAALAGAATSAVPATERGPGPETSRAPARSVAGLTMVWPPGRPAKVASSPTPPAPTVPRPGRGAEVLHWLRALDRRVSIAAGAVALLLVAVGIFAMTGGDDDVVLLGTDQPGDDPFGPTLVVEGGVTPSAGLEPSAAHDRIGSQDGLYFDTTGAASCNRGALGRLLAQDQKRAQAWGMAVGATATDVPGYVGTLTPVRLRADTRVTAFSYVDGEARRYPAVLRAGTAVLVDNRGLPQADCANSGPLAVPPHIDDPHYKGTPWPGFNPDAVTEIRPSATVLGEFGLVGANGVAPFRRPSGSDGGQDIAQSAATGRLDGRYTLTGSMVHCNGFPCAEGNGRSLSMDVVFNGCPSSCVLASTGIRGPGGDVWVVFNGNLPLARAGDAWQLRTTVTGTCSVLKTRIAKGPTKGTEHLTITVAKSAVDDGVWKATQLRIDYEADMDATGSCPPASRGFSLNGTAQ